MKSAKFYILHRDAFGELTPKEVEGFIKEVDGAWFGIHSEGRANWVVTELTTGLKCSKNPYSNKQKAEASITTELLITVANLLTAKRTYEQYTEIIRKAYEEGNAEMFWKLYPEG